MMLCPVCSAQAKIQETRKKEGTNVRRYWCTSGHKFVTTEVLDRVFTDDGIRGDRLENMRIAREKRRAL